MKYMKTIRDKNVKDKIVLMRVDYNVPLKKGEIIDENYDDSVLIEQSIRPGGWTLPRAYYGEGSFYDLWYSRLYNSTNTFKDKNGNDTFDDGEEALWTDPLYAIPSGIFGDGGLHNVGSDAYFWSAVSYLVQGIYEARHAYYNLRYQNATASYARYHGMSVRCVARPVSDTLQLSQH